MATGNTTTDALADSLDDVRSSARIVREYEGVMQRLVTMERLGEGIGLSWQELSYDQLTAMAITETTESNNPQQIVDTLLSITPTMVQIHTVILDRVANRINKKGFAKLGQLGQNAVERKVDEDGLVVLDGATTSLGSSGTTATASYIAAAQSRIAGNTTEPGNPPYYAVLHPFVVKDFYDEIISGVGTYPIGDDSTLTGRVFKEGFKGMVSNAQVIQDGNVTIDGSTDAKGGVFAKEGIILVRGRAPNIKVLRNEKIGGGASEVLHNDEYAYGEKSAGNWVYELYFNATAPTS